jgi:hypothetical protein
MADGAVKLVRVTPTPYKWSRWDVTVGGDTVGQLERRGGFAPWRATTGDTLVATRSTRMEALDALLAYVGASKP